MWQELLLEPMTDRRRQCRGRNGFFDGSRIFVVKTEQSGTLPAEVLVEVYSSKVGRDAPIRISLTPEDARKLGEILRGEDEWQPCS